MAILMFALATFGIQGLANWSGRAPALGTIILWTFMAAAIVATLLWFIAVQRGSLRWRGRG